MDTTHAKLREIITQVGDILPQFMGSEKVVSEKQHRDILHEADLASNRLFLSLLTECFPEIPILTEEDSASHTAGKRGKRFVIDPLDGTINFSREIPEYGTFLALQEDQKTIYGFAYKPAIKVLYEGVTNGGAWVNEKTLQVSRTQRLQEAVVAVDFSRSESIIPPFTTALQNNARGFRSYGCAIQALSYIAEGKIDAYLYTTPKIWDITAMEVIITEAGGGLFDFKGRPWQEGAPLLVCTPQIKDEILSIIATHQ